MDERESLLSQRIFNAMKTDYNKLKLKFFVHDAMKMML